jgi:hypothetical protein
MHMMSCCCAGEVGAVQQALATLQKDMERHDAHGDWGGPCKNCCTRCVHVSVHSMCESGAVVVQQERMKHAAAVGNSMAGEMWIRWCSHTYHEHSWTHTEPHGPTQHTAGHLAKRQKVIGSLKAALQKEQKQHGDKQANLQGAEQRADAAARSNDLLCETFQCMHTQVMCMHSPSRSMHISMYLRICTHRRARQLEDQKCVLDNRVSALWKERTSLMQQIKVGHALLVSLPITAKSCAASWNWQPNKRWISAVASMQVQAQLLNKLMQGRQETNRQLAALRAVVDKTAQAAPSASQGGSAEVSHQWQHV